MNNLFKFRMKAFALAAVLLVSVLGAFAQERIAIIDAGSSGSRLYVYEISKDGKSISNLCNAKKDLPLSKVAAHKDSVKVYMDIITSQYKTDETIPLYVLATAGMRTGNSESQVYAHIRNYSNKHYKVKKAMTISGRYEGLYAWIALNYESKKLGYGISTPQKPLTYTSGSTFGIIEIGGASMQIAFAAQSSGYNPKDLVDRQGFSNIYCKSYLGGGVDRIFEDFPDPAVCRYSAVIKDLPKLDKPVVFYGLGTPLKIAVNSLQKKSFDEYINGLPDDTKENHHPKSNANYIRWLADSLGIPVQDIRIPDTEISWTKGAVIDIVINKNEPEPFDYSNPN